MEGFIAKLGWKKLAIIIASLSIIVLIFSLYSLVTTTNSPKKTKSTSRENSDNWTTSSGEKLKGKFSVEKSGVYSNPYYELAYPDYYQVEEVPQGDALSVTKFADKASSASIVITAVDKSKKSIEEMESPYTVLGSYDPESYPLGDFVVDEYYKTDPQTGKLLEKVFFIEKEGKIIKVDFTYTGSAPNYKLERDFLRIVSSIK
jgi:hypothetical protein